MDTTKVKHLVEQCIEEFKRHELTEQGLQRIIDCIDSGVDKRQDLLYLQAHNTSVTSGLHGMSLVENGAVSEGPSDTSEWPYRSVLEAMRDGWRIISFPNLALLVDDSCTYGLGCEFILERWR